MTAPARTAAFRALAAIASSHRDLPTALVESRRHLTDERDRSLAAAIVQGTLRWQRACDYLIGRVSARSLESLDQEVLVILRLSLFQILHLDRVPSAAVVDDAVNLTRAAGKRARQASSMPFSDPHSVSATVCRCHRGRMIPPIARQHCSISV